MELKDYVSEVLTQIIEGVKKSQEYAAENGAMIMPIKTYPFNAATADTFVDDRKRLGFAVNFEVAITISSESSKASGFKIGISGIGAKADKDQSSTTSNVNKIAFSIPVFYPTQNK